MKIAAKTQMSSPFPPDIDGKKQWSPSHEVLINGVPYSVRNAYRYGGEDGFTEVTLIPIAFTAILEPGEQLEYVTEWAEMPDA